MARGDPIDQPARGAMRLPLGAGSRLSLDAARRHSRRVRNLRLVVPALGIALLGTYAVSATPPRIDPEFVRDFNRLDPSEANVRLDKPRYVGEDRAGIPFEVAASAAERNPAMPDLIALENPESLRALAARDGGGDVQVRARSGLLNTESRFMDLTDDVEVTRGEGDSLLVLRTEGAAVDLNTNTVRSTAPVTGESARGAVAADNLTAYQDEGRLILEGNVRLRLAPREGAGGEDDPATDPAAPAD